MVDRPDEHGPALALNPELCREVGADHVPTLAPGSAHRGRLGALRWRVRPGSGGSGSGSGTPIDCRPPRPALGVAAITGYTSVRMIERHYGALLDGAHNVIASRLDAFEAEQAVGE